MIQGGIKMKIRGFFQLVLILCSSIYLNSGETLRILTVNVWSGLDVGLGREATGLYFNFGHIF